jgi:hypothetical protein
MGPSEGASAFFSYLFDRLLTFIRRGKDEMDSLVDRWATISSPDFVALKDRLRS